MHENRTPTDDSRKTFEQLARELECDESEERFEAVVRKVAKASKAGAEESENSATHKNADQDS
jgi:hypothetical protein